MHHNFRCGKDLQGKGKNDGQTVKQLNQTGQDTIGERDSQDGIDVVAKGRPTNHGKKAVKDNNANNGAFVYRREFGFRLRHNCRIVYACGNIVFITPLE